MAKKADAKRAQKKFAKEKKRQKKLSARETTANRTLLDRWKPRVHGIEGLARLLKLDAHDASQVAERLATERKDARVTWHPSRVHALATDALLAELAMRGVTTDQAAFVALAARYESARKLAAENWPTADTATPHDRDLIGQAAEELWARWLPGTPTDERLRDRWRAAEDLRYDDPATCAAELLDLLEAVGPDRVTRAGGAPAVLLGTLVMGDELSRPDDARRARVDAVLRAWQAAQAVGTPAWTSATVLVAHHLSLEERVTEVLDRVAQDPTNETLLNYALDELLHEERGPLHARLEAAYEGAIAATEGETRAGLEQDLARLREGPGDEDWEGIDDEEWDEDEDEWDEDEIVETPP